VFDLKPYLKFMGCIWFLVFLCGIAFTFTQTFLTAAVASGFTQPPLPGWAREAIWDWIFGIPQEVYSENNPIEIADTGKNWWSAGGGGGGRNAESAGGGAGGPSQLNKYAPNYDIRALIASIYFQLVEGFLPPTELDINMLERFRGRTRISGLDFYWWYSILYNNKDGWWWKVFGNDEDGFTIWDAMGVIMYYEAQLQWDNPYLAEAAVRKAHSYCLAIYGHPCETVEEFVNWFAAHNQSAGNHVLDLNLPKDDYSQIMTDEDIAGLRALVDAFQNHPEEWKNGCTSTSYAMSRPCGWANMSYWKSASRNKMANNPDYLYTYEGYGDPWVIPSGCVWAFWGGGVRLNTSAYCPRIHP
jgi:hypothetical protein